MDYFEMSGDPENLRFIVSPGYVDFLLRMAIKWCWLVLPEEKKNVEEVSAHMRELLKRALADLAEDADTFGMPD